MTKFTTWLRWAAALAVCTATLLMGWQCLDIFFTGAAKDAAQTPPFRADDIAGRLHALAVPLWLCAAVIVAAVIAGRWTRSPQRQTAVDPEMRLHKRLQAFSILPEAARREARFRRGVKVATAVVVALCAAPILAYLLDGRNFTSWALDPVVGDMLLHTLPWIALGFAAVYAASVICARSMEREIAVLEETPSAPSAGEVPANHRRLAGFVRLLLYAVAVAFIVLGVMNGGLRDVLVKATNICTECIGLG